MTAQKFRKKPVVIEAMQWTWAGGAAAATPIIQWVLDGGGTARYREAVDIDTAAEQRRFMREHIAIDTLEGTVWASVGDWIIRGVQGEFYPCKPDIFAATYEAVES